VQATPVVKDLVLVGGGHSHIEVVKRFAMRPQPGVRLTLISREVQTPYSGMLPGLVAGHYTFDDAHIDLGPLVQMAGGRLYHDDVIGVDPDAKLIKCRRRPPVAYDVLSLDIGSAPDTAVDGAAEFAIPVKPVSNFTERWAQAEQRILSSTQAQQIGFVGGGAGSIELLLAIRHRLLGKIGDFKGDLNKLSFHLIAASEQILPSHNRRVQKKFERLLRTRGVKLELGDRVVRVENSAVTTASGKTISLNELFWVTNASAPAWLAASGLALDATGFIRVHESLESVSHPTIFASGDIASVDKYPRAKSGVFAVRQGPPLAKNLRRLLTGDPLRPFKPQRAFLSLISTGDRYAIGSRGPFALEGRWVWRWKDWIDRRFMQKYQDLPDMSTTLPTPASGHALDKALHDLQADPMRCGGCGSKVGADVLRDALSTLQQQQHDEVIIGLEQPDDAAVVESRPGTVLVQTVDSFRSFIDDPFVFGQIAANHCLSDIFAMGATPQTALAIVTLPLASAKIMRDDLVQLMSGALEVFSAADTAIVGGHTNEGAELTLGFAVNGYIQRERLNRKSGAQPGDRLILTKPLGTGVLFAGAMRGKAQSRWIEAALETMLQSNGPGARCLREHGASALTDVTGFGLFGHLIEMLRGAKLGATLTVNALPLLDGAAALAAEGILSTLQTSNLSVESLVRAESALRGNAAYPLCFDPQTSGGLLATVPAAEVDACIAQLHKIGCDHATVIGSIKSLDPASAEPLIRLS
jgi:selenide,water dikinase